MGIRFRKSVKIAKGVRINFSKSGASLTLGGRGLSVNFSKRGTRATVGIPGTGLSYSAMIDKDKTPSSSRTPLPAPDGVKISMNEHGQIIFEDGAGKEITDKTLRRKIRSMPQYKSQIAQLEKQRMEKNLALVREAEAENDRFINIYRLSPPVEPLSAFEERFSRLKPAENAEERTFDVPVPSVEDVRNALLKEAEEAVQGPSDEIAALRKQYVDTRLAQRMWDAFAVWDEERKAFDRQQEEDESAADIVEREEYERQKSFLRSLIDGDDLAVCEAFDAWIRSCELPVEINVSYFWDQVSGLMQLDVDLPEIEDLNGSQLVSTENGDVREKKKTQAELRGEYARLVFGLAVFIAANTFNISPAIKRILISGYTQREKQEGTISDDYIFSLKFAREAFEHTDLSSADPQTVCLAAENRCSMTSTALFRPIIPFEIFDISDESDQGR